MRSLLATVLLTTLPTVASFATVLVNTDFDTGYTTGALAGQSGSADVNLAGTYGASASGVGATVQNSSTVDLTYNVSGGGTISGGSHSLQVTTNSGTVSGSAFTRAFDTGIGGQTLYLRAVIQANTTPLSVSYLLFQLNPTSGNGGWVGVADSFTSANPVAAAELNTTDARSSSISTGTPNLVVASYNWDTATSMYDSVSIWLNPTATSQNTPDSTAGLVTPFAPTFTSAGLLILNNPNDRSFNVDSFAVGTTWSDVVAVPEPSTYAYLLVALALPFLFRKKRQINS